MQKQIKSKAILTCMSNGVRKTFVSNEMIVYVVDNPTITVINPKRFCEHTENDCYALIKLILIILGRYL